MREHRPARPGQEAFPRGRSPLLQALAAAAVPIILLAYYREHLPDWGQATSVPPGAGHDWGFASSLLPAAGCLALLVIGADAWGRLIEARVGWGAGSALERLLARQGVGLAVFSGFAFLAGELGWLHPAIAWAAILGPLLVAVVRVASSRRAKGGLRDFGASARRALQGAEPLEWAALAAAAVFLVGGLIAALAPLTANDALVYHLNLPRIYLAAHSTAPVPWNVYSRMPGGQEMLYTFSRAQGAEATPRLLYWWLGALVLAAGWALARRHSRRAASLALLVLAGTPLLGDPRTVGNIDPGITFFFALAILAAPREGEGEPRGRGGMRAPLLLAGVFLGVAGGMRYTALALAALTAIFLLFRRGGRPSLRDALLLGGPLLLLAAPWFLRGALRSGNPVYPLLWTKFGGREWSAGLGEELLAWQRQMGMGRGLGAALLLPWNVSIHGQVASGYRFFDGVVGPWYLALLLVWLASIRARVAWERWEFALLAAGFVMWGAGPQQVRFAMPLLVVAAALGAGALADLRWGRVRAAICALLAAGALFEAGAVCVRAARESGPVLTGEITTDSYLQGRIQSYAAMAASNRVLPANAKLLLIWENRGYYLARPYLADSFFEASQFMDLAGECASPEALAARLRAMGVTHVLYNDFLGRYFLPRYGERERDLLDTFRASQLTPVGSAAGVELSELRPLAPR